LCAAPFFSSFVVGAIHASKVTVDFKERYLTPYDSQPNRFAEALKEYEEESIWPGSWAAILPRHSPTND
jgi:hypothetical protein